MSDKKIITAVCPPETAVPNKMPLFQVVLHTEITQSSVFCLLATKIIENRWQMLDI